MEQFRTMSAELTELRARVQQWRKQQGGGRGTRIPEQLWQEAIKVARIDGVYATTRATRLNYQRLKQLSTGASERAKERAVGVAGQKGSPAVKAEDGDEARFIALQVAPVRPGHPTTIELWGRQGDRVRVQVSGELDVSGLVQALWSRRS